jgi:pimeloyl-ACP methyl ester carboxylesterase
VERLEGIVGRGRELVAQRADAFVDGGGEFVRDLAFDVADAPQQRLEFLDARQTSRRLRRGCAGFRTTVGRDALRGVEVRVDAHDRRDLLRPLRRLQPFGEAGLHELRAQDRIVDSLQVRRIGVGGRAAVSEKVLRGGFRERKRLREQSLAIGLCHAAYRSSDRGARLVNAFVDPALGTIDRYGAAGGPLVIAFHGAVANRKTWLPLARALPSEVELWCPDLPGHGSRRGEPFVFARALAAVHALVARAAPRRPLLAGDSLGGYVALAAAAHLPDGGRGALAGVAAGGCSWSMTGAGGALARASDVPPQLVETLLGTARFEDAGAALLARLTDPETAAAIARAGLRLASRGESLRELAGVDVVELAARLGVPLAIVNGAFDWPTRAGESAMLRAARDARLFVSPRSGHGVGFFDAPFFASALVALGAQT